MKWIKGQLWCLAGAVLAALIITAYYHLTVYYSGYPADHGFLAALIISSIVIGALLGLMEGAPAMTWVFYAYVASFLFGILNIRPFASHDVPPSIVAALYALYAAPSGLLGTGLGMIALFIHKKRKTKGQQWGPGYPSQGAGSPDP